MEHQTYTSPTSLIWENTASHYQTSFSVPTNKYMSNTCSFIKEPHLLVQIYKSADWRSISTIRNVYINKLGRYECNHFERQFSWKIATHTHIPVTLCPDARFFYRVCVSALNRFVQTNPESIHKRKCNINFVIYLKTSPLIRYYQIKL